MGKFWMSVTVVVHLLVFVACDEADSGGDGDNGAPSDRIAVKWEQCSLYEGENDGAAECASTEMPLRWESEDEQTFTSAAKRFLKGEGANAQVWFLHGGPGSSGTIGLPFLMEIYNTYAGVDAYTLDYRGTGHSQYLGCPEQEAAASVGGEVITSEELPGCINYINDNFGDRLDAYSFRQDAHDLAAYIDATREERKKVFIWAASGGTIWAQRFLQLYPSKVDGVILEGIAPTDFSIAIQDESADSIAKQILNLCAKDSFCSKKLPDPIATAKALFLKIANGHCSELADSPDELIAGVKQVFQSLSFFSPENTLIPAIIYRLDRCSDEDVGFLSKLVEVADQVDFEPGMESSTVLLMLLMYSELWYTDDLPDENAMINYLTKVNNDALFSSGAALAYARIADSYPTYNDVLDNQWAETSVPMLMLQGELDPSTPHAEAVRMQAHYSGPYQHYVSFPYAAHNVTFESPDGLSLPFGDCAFSIILDFLERPKLPLSTSCVSQTFPLDFEGKGLAKEVFGTTNLFED